MNIYVNDNLIGGTNDGDKAYAMLMDYIRRNHTDVFNNLVMDRFNLSNLLHSLGDGVDGYSVSCLLYNNRDGDINDNCVTVDFD